MKNQKNLPSTRRYDLIGESKLNNRDSFIKRNNFNKNYNQSKKLVNMLTQSSIYDKKISNKENISTLANNKMKKNKSISRKNTSSSREKNNTINNSIIMRKTLIEKCKLKCNNYQHKIDNYNTLSNKIKVNKKQINKYVKKNIFSPEVNRDYNSIYNNSIPNFYKNRLTSYKNPNSVLTTNDYIKIININVDCKKIIQIQRWWKYLHKIILIQKRVRAFILHKKVKTMIKTKKFVKTLKYLFYNKLIKSFDTDIDNNEIKILKNNLNESIANNTVLLNNFNKTLLAAGNIKHLPDIKELKSSKNSKRFFSPMQDVNFIEENKKTKINIKTCSKQYLNNSMNNSIESNLRNSMSNLHKRENSKLLTTKNIITRNNIKEDNKSFYNKEENINTYNIINNIYNNIKEYYNNFNNNNNKKNVAKNINSDHNSLINSSSNYNKNNKKSNIINKKINNIHSNKVSKKSFNTINNNLNKIQNIPKRKKKISMTNINSNNYIKKTEDNKKTDKEITTTGNNSNNTFYLGNNLNNTNNVSNSISSISPFNKSTSTFNQIKQNINNYLEMRLEPVKYLIKCKKHLIYWKNLVIKRVIIKKLHSINLIKNFIKKNNFLYFLEKINLYNENKFKYINNYFNRYKEIVEKSKIVDLLRYYKINQNTSNYYSTNGNKALNVILNNKDKNKKKRNIKTRKIYGNHSMIDLHLTDTSISNNLERCMYSLYYGIWY